MAIERTLCILKPDATRRNLTGAITDKIEKAGFRVVAQKRLKLTQEQGKQFYAVHSERPFFQELYSYISSEPVVVMVLEKANAVADYRKLMGATNPENAEPGTIRKEFALSISENTVHGSDSLENASIEIAFFFSGTEIVG